jgi:hypothetical protein
MLGCIIMHLFRMRVRSYNAMDEGQSSSKWQEKSGDGK